MTDHQALQLFKTAGIISARSLEGTPSLQLSMKKGDSTVEILLTDLRAELQSRVKVLEEERREILKNTYASRATTTFTMGGSSPMTMEALKRNDQLTSQERIEKTDRLMAIDGRVKSDRGLLLALAHLQVNSKDLLPKLTPDSTKPATAVESIHPSGKKLWTRGLKAAALYCLHESQRRKADDRALFVLCEEFFENYFIEDEGDYSPEKLFQNVRQVRLLDTFE